MNCEFIYLLASDSLIMYKLTLNLLKTEVMPLTGKYKSNCIYNANVDIRMNKKEIELESNASYLGFQNNIARE